MLYAEKESVHLTGLDLKKKTFNAGGQSAIDCGGLWREFEERKISAQLADQSNGEIYAVYYNYEGDHTKPYSYFIGCPVAADSPVPDGLDHIVIPKGTYQLITAKGRMPDCVAAAWQDIWTQVFPRAYQYDFEVYDKRSADWSNVEVDIFLSVNPR